MIWILFIVGLVLGVIFNVWWHKLKDKRAEQALMPGPYTSDLSPAEVVAIEKRGTPMIFTRPPAPSEWKPKPGGRDWQHDSDGQPVDRGLVPTMFLDSFLLRHFHSIIQIPPLSSGFVPTWEGFTKANPWALGLDQVFFELSGFKLTRMELDQVAAECADRLRAVASVKPEAHFQIGDRCELKIASMNGEPTWKPATVVGITNLSDPTDYCYSLVDEGGLRWAAQQDALRPPQSANAVEPQPASDRPEERQPKSGSIL